MIAVTPVPNARPAIACVRSRRRPNRTNTGQRDQRRDQAVRDEPVVDERARGEHDAGSDGRAEREPPPGEERQRDPEHGEDVEPERPGRPVLVALPDDDLGQPDAE